PRSSRTACSRGRSSLSFFLSCGEVFEVGTGAASCGGEIRKAERLERAGPALWPWGGGRGGARAHPLRGPAGGGLGARPEVGVERDLDPAVALAVEERAFVHVDAVHLFEAERLCAELHAVGELVLGAASLVLHGEGAEAGGRGGVGVVLDDVGA